MYLRHEIEAAVTSLRRELGTLLLKMESFDGDWDSRPMFVAITSGPLLGCSAVREIYLIGLSDDEAIDAVCAAAREAASEAITKAREAAHAFNTFERYRVSP